MTTSATAVVVSKLTATVPKRLPRGALTSMPLGDALVDRRVRPRDWSRMLKNGQNMATLFTEREAMISQLRRSMSPGLQEEDTPTTLHQSFKVDSAVAEKKLAMLVQSISSWENALSLASLASKLHQKNEGATEATDVQTPAALTSSQSVATLALPGATRSTLLHLYRTLIAGGKRTEASHLLVLNANQLHHGGDRSSRRRSLRHTTSEVASFLKLITSLDTIHDTPTMKYLHDELTVTQQTSPLQGALGRLTSLVLARRLTELLLRQTSGLSKMERASVTLKFAVMCPGGALPMPMRELWEHATPPPPVTRKLLSALDRRATEAAFMPWSTIQDHHALWTSPLSWLRRERELVIAASSPPSSAKRVAATLTEASPTLSRLKESLLQENQPQQQQPSPQLHDVLCGVTALREAMMQHTSSSHLRATQHQQHYYCSRRTVQETLATLLSSTTSPRMSLWLLTSKAQRSSLCRMARSQLIGPLLAYLARDVMVDQSKSSDDNRVRYTASARQLDRLTISCALLWRRSNVGRHRLLESARCAEGQRFASVMEVVLTVVSALTERHSPTTHTLPEVVSLKKSRRRDRSLPKALRASIRRAWAAGWVAQNTNALSSYATATTIDRQAIKEVCCTLARELFPREANGRCATSLLAKLPLATSVSLITSLHEAGLPFQDVKLLTQRLAAAVQSSRGKGEEGVGRREGGAAFLLDVIRLGSSRHYRAVSQRQGSNNDPDSTASQFQLSAPPQQKVVAYPTYRAPTRSALIALQSLMKHCTSLCPPPPVVAYSPIVVSSCHGDHQYEEGSAINVPSHSSVSVGSVTPEQRQFMEVLLTTFVKAPHKAADLIRLKHSSRNDAEEGSEESHSPSSSTSSSSSQTRCRAESIEEHFRLMAALSVLSNSSDVEFTLCAASGLGAVMDPRRVQCWLEAEGLQAAQ